MANICYYRSYIGTGYELANVKRLTYSFTHEGTPKYPGHVWSFSMWFTINNLDGYS